MKINNSPIGVFDSGLGGLTVLKALKKALPNEPFIYFGDTAHVPYGNKSKISILHYSNKIIRFLQSQNVKLIIVACNTVSSTVLKQLREEAKVPVLDVITPISYLMKQVNNISTIGIIGTRNTIQSKAYQKIILSSNPHADIYTQECPLFVPLIEEGFQNHQVAQLLAAEYLDSLKIKKLDMLILGCTHYPMMKETIQKIFETKTQIIDSAEITAVHVKQYLKKNNLLCNNTKETQIYVSDSTNHFIDLSNRFLGEKISKIKTIVL